MDLKMHPMNKGFIWPDKQGPFRRISAQQGAGWNEQGYILLEQVVSHDDIAMLQSVIDPVEQRINDLLRINEGERRFISRADELTFSVHIVLESPRVRAFVAAPLFVDLCHDLLGVDARLYWDQAVYKKPGSPEEFPWHQDNGYTFVLPQDYLTCWIPLVNTRIENGCPWVVPGAHRLGTLAHWTTHLGYQCLDAPDNAVPIEANAGDMVVFSSLTPHRTGPNLTTEDRKAYIVQYAQDGAVMYPGGSAPSIPQNDPARQFRITA